MYLRYTHICKVSSDDIVSIEYKEDYVGSKWTKIPNSRYEGSSQTYRKQRTFHDESYVEWVGNDLLAEPDNSWWMYLLPKCNSGLKLLKETLWVLNLPGVG